ncbi:MAG: hypothetical protein ACJ8H8_21110, partial [Geminicoccaceae bacterium]
PGPLDDLEQQPRHQPVRSAMASILTSSPTRLRWKPIEPLTDSRRAAMGLVANNVIPHGDTIAGLKYVGRRFVADCARAERLRDRPFFGRLGMQLSLAARSAGASP